MNDFNLLTDRLNETGFPFQEWCYDTINNLNIGRAVKEYPYTYPPSQGSSFGNFGSIDILSLKHPESDTDYNYYWIIFSIECKKVKDSIKKWCFINSNRGGILNETYIVSRIKRIGQTQETVKKVFPVSDSTLDSIEINNYISCYETNKLISNLNRNQEEKIYKSLLQAIHGCRFIEERDPPIIKELGLSETILNTSKDINLYFLYIPVVVTTAELYSAKFNPNDIEGGEINNNKVKWNQKDWIAYDFGLPDYLNHKERTFKDIINNVIFIVNDKKFVDFYKNFNPQVVFND